MCRLGYHYSHTIGFHADAFKYTVKAADLAISKGAYSLGLELLTSAMELSRHDVEIKMLTEVTTSTIHDMIRMSGKRSRIRMPVGGSEKSTHSSRSETFTTGGQERDVIMEYKHLLTALEQPRNFHHHGQHNPHDKSSDPHPGLLSQLKQRSVGSFMSAFGDDEKSSKEMLGFQLSFTKLEDDGPGHSSPKKGANNVSVPAGGHCGCTVS